MDLSSWARKIETDQSIGYHGNEDDEEEVKVRVAEENVDLETDCSYHTHEKYKDGLLTIGCIGN